MWQNQVSFIEIERCPLFRGVTNVGQNQVSLIEIERCPLFRGSFFREVPLYLLYKTLYVFSLFYSTCGATTGAV